MDTNILHFLSAKSPPLTIPINSNRSNLAPPPPPPPLQTIQTQFSFILRSRRRSLRLSATSSDETPTPPPPPPPTVEIRFKRGSKRRSRLQKEGDGAGVSQAVKKKETAPKKWEDMSFSEKALQLYVGEKGMLFWLNKFAYASIFIMIGGWIFFRFIGPALNLYQLDTDPLPPSAILKPKGS